jgi:hypothetical protein
MHDRMNSPATTSAGDLPERRWLYSFPQRLSFLFIRRRHVEVADAFADTSGEKDRRGFRDPCRSDLGGR